MITLTLTLEEAEELVNYAMLGANEYGEPDDLAHPFHTATDKLNAAIAAADGQTTPLEHGPFSAAFMTHAAKRIAAEEDKP